MQAQMQGLQIAESEVADQLKSRIRSLQAELEKAQEAWLKADVEVKQLKEEKMLTTKRHNDELLQSQVQGLRAAESEVAEQLKNQTRALQADLEKSHRDWLTADAEVKQLKEEGKLIARRHNDELMQAQQAVVKQTEKMSDLPVLRGTLKKQGEELERAQVTALELQQTTKAQNNDLRSSQEALQHMKSLQVDLENAQQDRLEAEAGMNTTNKEVLKEKNADVMALQVDLLNTRKHLEAAQKEAADAKKAAEAELNQLKEEKKTVERRHNDELMQAQMQGLQSAESEVAEQLKNQIRSLQADLLKSQEEWLTADAEVKQLKEERQLREDAEVAKESEMSELRTINQSLKTQLKALHDDLEKLQKQLLDSSLEAMLVKLREENQQLADQVTSLSCVTTDLSTERANDSRQNNQELFRAQETILNLQLELQEKANILDATTKEVAGLKESLPKGDEISRLKDQLKEQGSRSNTEVMELHTKLLNTIQTLEAAQKEAGEAKKAAEAARKERDEADELAARATKELADTKNAETAVRLAEEKLGKAQTSGDGSRIDAAEKELVIAKETLEKERKESEEAAAVAAKAEAEAREAEACAKKEQEDFVAANEAAIDQLQKALAAMTEENSTLQTKMETLRTKFNMLNDELMKAQTEVLDVPRRQQEVGMQQLRHAVCRLTKGQKATSFNVWCANAMRANRTPK